MKSKIPLYYYPTQVVFVDDNIDFLNTMQLALSPKFNIKTFNSCHKALEYLNNQNIETTVNKENAPKPEGESDAWIKRVLTRQQTKRFVEEKTQETSVVVVDFSMPEMNGIEFCNQLNNTSLKRILLTGFATTTDAVRAFNNNVINYYIKKNEDDMLAELKKSIEQLQLAFFNDLSHDIKSDAIDSVAPFFADQELADYFETLCLSMKIKEYYYQANPSRFLLQEETGNRHLWVVYTEEDLYEHLQVMTEEQAPAELMQAIKSRTAIPLFRTVDGFYDQGLVSPMEQIYPAVNVAGKTNYFCGLISDISELPKAAINAFTGSLH